MSITPLPSFSGNDITVYVKRLSYSIRLNNIPSQISCQLN